MVAAALLLVPMAGCASAQRPARAPAPGQPHLTVLSYNVNLGLAGDPATLAAIARADVDVIFLQETTPAWELPLRNELAKRYPYIGFKHCCRAGGLAVLSKYPFEDADYVASPIGWFPGWRVVVDSPLGKVQVLQVHLRPPVSDSGSWLSGYFTTDSYRHREITEFVRSLDPKIPAVVLGDFNEESGDAIGFLKERGMRDALSEFHPDATTWRWPTRLGEITFTLDHVMYDVSLAPLSAEVLDAGRSDHLPLRVAFEHAPPETQAAARSGSSLSL